MCTVGHAKLSEQLIFQTGGCLHQKLTTSLGGGSTSFFIFLPILEKKKMQKVWKCDLHIIDSHTRHLSVIYVLWRRAISPSHFYPIKACNVCREYCKCTDCSVCSCWKHWFSKNLLLRQLRTAVLLGWERWLYLWPDFEVSEQQHSTFAHHLCWTCGEVFEIHVTCHKAGMCAFFCMQLCHAPAGI